MRFIQEQALFRHIFLQPFDLALFLFFHAMCDSAWAVDFSLLKFARFVVIAEASLISVQVVNRHELIIVHLQVSITHIDKAA